MGVQHCAKAGWARLKPERCTGSPGDFAWKTSKMKVYTWHGEADVNAPFAAHGKVLAERLPNVEAKFYPGEGHISLIHYLETILQTLIA